MADLFSGLDPSATSVESLTEGATVLHGFAAAEADNLVATLATLTEAAPFRHMVTPGGFTMSVAMTNCGDAGWVSDRHGYRYDRRDPESGVEPTTRGDSPSGMKPLKGSPVISAGPPERAARTTSTLPELQSTGPLFFEVMA